MAILSKSYRVRVYRPRRKRTDRPGKWQRPTHVCIATQKREAIREARRLTLALNIPGARGEVLGGPEHNALVRQLTAYVDRRGRLRLRENEL